MLSLENITYRYKKGFTNVLNSVWADFEAGKFTAIVGPSGSGKSTLLSIMAGLDRPKWGRVMVFGEPLSAMDSDLYRREKISMIFQAFHLFPLLTVMENVCYPMEMNNKPKAQAKEEAGQLLMSVGISKEKHNRYPATLSGGEQQRVAIARSLSTGAKIILADEPTGNLDKKNSAAIVEILRGLAHNEKYAVIVVTHDVEIAGVSDVVYRMEDGKLKRDSRGKGA